jgi:hypothetical protein
MTAVRAALDSIIDAPHFDTARLAPLASRPIYPAAADALESILRRGNLPSPLAVLLDRWNYRVRASRLSWAFGVRSQEEHYHDGDDFTTADLRAVAKRKDSTAERARETLAALGEIDWPKATPRARAAFVLGALVRLRLCGPP